MKDIEILEEFAKEYKDTGYFGIIKAEQIQILDNILKERQADKEKIKELEEEIDDWKFTKKYVEDNYIHKNEIKKEIEELGNMKVSGDVFITSVNFAIKILQELLKDGGE